MSEEKWDRVLGDIFAALDRDAATEGQPIAIAPPYFGRFLLFDRVLFSTTRSGDSSTAEHEIAVNVLI
jgi:hypothetical protein